MRHVAFIILHIEVKLNVGISVVEFSYDGLHRERMRSVVRHESSMMGEHRDAKRQKARAKEKGIQEFGFHAVSSFEDYRPLCAAAVPPGRVC